jgi:hypothetical protein
MKVRGRMSLASCATFSNVSVKVSCYPASAQAPPFANLHSHIRSIYIKFGPRRDDVGQRRDRLTCYDENIRLFTISTTWEGQEVVGDGALFGTSALVGRNLVATARISRLGGVNLTHLVEVNQVSPPVEFTQVLLQVLSQAVFCCALNLCQEL